jgi:hypothetical protein
MNNPSPSTLALPVSGAERRWFLVGLAGVFLRALPNLRYPIGHDEAIFCVMGEGLLRGQALYRDVWDIKSPGIYFVYAAIVKLFDHVMWSVGVVDLIWLLVISCCIFYFARPYIGAPAAALAMVFNTVRHCRQGYIHAAQPETFFMLCVFAVWFLLRRSVTSPTLLPRAASPPGRGRLGQDSSLLPEERLADGGGRMRGLAPLQRALAKSRWLGKAGYVVRYLAVGLLMGAAFWLKYNSIAFLPFLVLVPFLDFRAWDEGLLRVRMRIPWKSWWVRMLFVAAGFLLAILAMFAYFWASGTWPAMKETEFVVLPRCRATGFPTDSYFLVWALRRIQNHLGFWTEIMAPLSLLAAWRLRELRRLAPVFSMALAGLICAAMPARFLLYYFEACYPFFSMFWGYICVKTWDGFQYARRVFEQHRWMVARPLLWLAPAVLVFALFAEEGVRIVQQYQFLGDWWRNPELSYMNYYYQFTMDAFAEQLRVIHFLKENSTPQDEVYVWGFAPLITFLSQRRNPSRFVYNEPLMATWGPESWRQELVRTLKTKRPRYIVVERDDWSFEMTGTMMDSEQWLRSYLPLAELLRRQYEPAVNFTDFEIYKLK